MEGHPAVCGTVVVADFGWSVVLGFHRSATSGWERPGTALLQRDRLHFMVSMPTRLTSEVGTKAGSQSGTIPGKMAAEINDDSELLLQHLSQDIKAVSPKPKLNSLCIHFITFSASYPLLFSFKRSNVTRHPTLVRSPRVIGAPTSFASTWTWS